MEKIYITLSQLSHKTGLSKQVLKGLVSKNKIPALNIGNRLKFNFEAVQKALDDLAANGRSDD